MSPAAQRELCAHLRDQIGDALRSVSYYDADTEQVVYVRDDVSSELSGDQAERIVRFLRNRTDIQQAYDELGREAALRCNVHCWEDRIGLHFPHGPESGTLVAVDPIVARELHVFVGQCRDILD